MRSDWVLEHVDLHDTNNKSSNHWPRVLCLACGGTRDDGGEDVFVHISAVERSGLTGLKDNQKVTYDLQAGRDGRESAINIQLA